MFRPHYSICVNCDKERLVVVKAGLCGVCNHAKKQAVIKLFSPLKNASEKLNAGRKILKKFKFKKATGEKDMFKSIWEKRERVSEVSGMPLLPESHPHWHWQFSHYLTKKSYGRFRLLEDNIFLCTPEEHQEYEFKSLSDPKWDKIKLKREELKQRYYAKPHPSIADSD